MPQVYKSMPPTTLPLCHGDKWYKAMTEPTIAVNVCVTLMHRGKLCIHISNQFHTCYNRWVVHMYLSVRSSMQTCELSNTLCSGEFTEDRIPCTGRLYKLFQI